MDTSFDERVAFCTLNRIFGFQPAITHTLIDTLGSASAVFALDQDALYALLGPGSRHLPLIGADELEKSRRELERLAREGYAFVTQADEGYPPLLRECGDAPAGLYVRAGTPALPTGRPMVAVVGTRDISPYGADWCRRVVEGLARTPERPVIVSGLAIGVDATAHVAALECGLPTLAVMATGIDDVYPARHRGLAARLCGTPDCALLTDYPPGTAPLAIHFLRRNRIIAGMTLATILIESRCKGGGMMTARLAHSYDRDVYALPGRADDIRSGGCNQLIRESIAEPICDVDTLVASLGFARRSRRSEAGLSGELDALMGIDFPDEDRAALSAVAQAIRIQRGITPDELCDRTGLDYAAVTRHLMWLETEGIVTADVLQRYSLRSRRR